MVNEFKNQGITLDSTVSFSERIKVMNQTPKSNFATFGYIRNSITCWGIQNIFECCDLFSFFLLYVKLVLGEQISLEAT